MAQAFLAGIALALALVAPVQAVVPDLRSPMWVKLTPQQKQTLAPLAQDWDKLDDTHKRKWLGVADRYPNMAPEEQERIQKRMKNWAELTPDERRKAREQFKNLQKAPPEQREALKQKWQEYESLPESEKKRLKESAARQPAPKSAAGKPISGANRPPKAASATVGQPIVAPAQSSIPAQPHGTEAATVPGSPPPTQPAPPAAGSGTPPAGSSVPQTPMTR